MPKKESLKENELDTTSGGRGLGGIPTIPCPHCRAFVLSCKVNAAKGKCPECGYQIHPESDYDDEKSTCVYAGTLIAMADGTSKKVEDIKAGDEVLAWDFNTGKFSKDKVIYNFHESVEAKLATVIDLVFEDSCKLSIVNSHSLFDLSKALYVEIGENYEEFIGDYFALMDGSSFKAVKLIKADVKKEVTKAYSPVTYKHINCVTNGFISVPGYFPIICNNFDVDVKTLKYINKNKDISKYGLLDYEEVKSFATLDLYNALDGSNIKVALGKNGKSLDDIAVILTKFDKEIEKLTSNLN